VRRQFHSLAITEISNSSPTRADRPAH
jgi:hypothetical protein